MRIAITGTRGIPNQYGGFEQFAGYLSVGLSELGHEVWVYSPQFHGFDSSSYRGVEIVRKKFYQGILGSAGNYFYDLSCLRDAIRRKADIILECGYASAAPWYPFLRFGKIKLVTHMDGMERQREKWGMLTRALFLRAEKQAVRCSDSIVCDHPEISAYYEERYAVKPAMIAYGASQGTDWDEDIPGEFGMSPGEYYLLVARPEPENKIRMIIEGFLASAASESLAIVGRYDGRYGRSIFKEFADESRLTFLGGLYDSKILDPLRHFSKAVFHGHSVGGTNPSLLESMAAGANIIAHDNIYNRWVLNDNAEWFHSAGDITSLVSNDVGRVQNSDAFISNNLKRVRSDFVWNDVVKKYEDLFKNLIERK